MKVLKRPKISHIMVLVWTSPKRTAAPNADGWWFMVRQNEPDDYSLDDLRRDVLKAKRFSIADILQFRIPKVPVENVPSVKWPVATDEDFRRLIAIIDAMTQEERRHPIEVIDRIRRERIAADAGVALSDVDHLLSQFPAMKEVMMKIRKMRRGRGLYLTNDAAVPGVSALFLSR